MKDAELKRVVDAVAVAVAREMVRELVRVGAVQAAAQTIDDDQPVSVAAQHLARVRKRVTR